MATSRPSRGAGAAPATKRVALKKVFGRLSVWIADRGSRQIRGGNTRSAEAKATVPVWGASLFFSYPKFTGILMLSRETLPGYQSSGKSQGDFANFFKIFVSASKAPLYK